MADLITGTTLKEVQTITDTAATLASNRFSTEAGDLSKAAQGPSSAINTEPDSLLMTNPYDKQVAGGGGGPQGLDGGQAGLSTRQGGVGGAGGGADAPAKDGNPGSLQGLPGGDSSSDPQKDGVKMTPEDITIKTPDAPPFQDQAVAAPAPTTDVPAPEPAPKVDVPPPVSAPSTDVPPPVSAPSTDVPPPVALPGTVHN